MNKNLFWKIVLIVALLVLGLWELYPPKNTLKLGLDLAGGTSIIYDIDTRGLDAVSKKGLAEKTIKVLRRRIDPSNMMNLEWLAQGNSRIEIKMPMASPDVIEKREKYNQALDKLAAKNINLAVIRRSLSKDADLREALFQKYSRGDADRLAILNDLARVYDQRAKLQSQRDSLITNIDSVTKALEDAGVDIDNLSSAVNQWVKLQGQELIDSIKEYAKGNGQGDMTTKIKLLTDYVKSYRQWVDVVNKLTDENTGLNIQYTEAISKLENLNLTVSQITDVLELDPDSPQRVELLNEMFKKYPGRKDGIVAVIKAYDAYSPYRGRLDGPEDLKRMLRGAGVLEYRILPKPGDDGLSAAMAQSYVDNLKSKGPQAASDNKFVWVEIEDKSNWKVPSSIVQKFGKKYYVLASNRTGEKMLANQDGKEWKLRYARLASDRYGRPAVGFAFNSVGSNMFYRLTDKNIGRPLVIILDGVALSAPVIRSGIGSRGGVIEGKFTMIEVQDMISKLDAGSLKARLIEPPVSENTIGPGIGEDNKTKGTTAAFIGLAVVALFMTFYYIGSGLLAVVALVMNLVFVLAIMAFSNATFTLAGIAGIILTIGMSVDANVLIFERIREELEKGSSLKIAIDSGYKRAFRTIFDANLTTFITAAILFYVASEEIKGFAITLMLGIASSMFTALFVTRVIFQLLVDMKILKNKLPMVKLIKKPNFSWMAARPVFFLISSVLIILGMLAFFTRDDQKNSKYDIEFTGGTSVTVDFKDGVDLNRDQVEAMIRAQGEKIKNPLISRAKVYTVGDSGSEYEITTIETNKSTIKVSFTDNKNRTAEEVKAKIVDAYNEIGRELENLTVVPDQEDASIFIVTTSQVNTTLISEVMNKAFDKEAKVSEPVVDKIVTGAIKAAFGDKLKVMINLEPEVVSAEKITPEKVENYPEITRFLGGIEIKCKLSKAASASEIVSRFEKLRFKPDLVKLTRSPYKLLTDDYSDLSDVDGKTPVDSFVVVAVNNQAGLVELTGKDWDNFKNTEIARVKVACSMESSLARVNQIAPSIGKQAKTQAIIAIFLSLIAIVGYIWVRFGTARYGLAAIAALVHDVCITLGAIVVCTYIAGTPLGAKLGIQDFKINLEIIAALLTIIGYSLNDTIVVFDRIRENKGKLNVLNSNIINDSINQTMSRTLLTSFTTFLAVFIMYVFGGAGLRGFTFAMMIGVVIGTYSSIAIAAPILVIGQKKSK